jgi:polyphosphate kinase
VTALRHPTARRGPPRADRSLPYINRELSWLDYSARILNLAQDRRNPLLERVRYLAIFASILDEFFQVRVAGVKQQVAAGHSTPSPDGMSSPQVLDAIRGRVLQLQTLHSLALADIRSSLAEESIRIVPYEERAERRVELRQQFLDEIFPVLTPLAVDPGHPFPYISDLSLSLAVTVRDPETG